MVVNPLGLTAHKKRWRTSGNVKTAITGLLAFAGTALGSWKAIQTTLETHTKAIAEHEARIVVLEDKASKHETDGRRIDNVERRQTWFDAEMLPLISKTREDVAYIRGKMDGEKRSP